MPLRAQLTRWEGRWPEALRNRPSWRLLRCRDAQLTPPAGWASHESALSEARCWRPASPTLQPQRKTQETVSDKSQQPRAPGSATPSTKEDETPRTKRD